MAKTECPLWRWGDPFVFNVLQCRKCWFDTGRITWCSLKKNALNLKHGLTWFSQNYKQAQGGRITPWISKNHQKSRTWEQKKNIRTNTSTSQLRIQPSIRFDFRSTGHGLIDASKGTILGWYINDLVSRPERGAITPVGIHPEPKGDSWSNLTVPYFFKWVGWFNHQLVFWLARYWYRSV